jgi:hypothetical protein
MNGRIGVAALLGGLVVFVWGALSHMVTELGEMGVQKLPNEAPVLAALKEHAPAGGLYLFPFEEDESKWEAAYADNPSGIASYAPAGTPLAFGRRLGLEFVTNVVGTLFAVLLLGGAGALATVAQRVLAGAALGAFASISINASYTIWYNFPTAYLVGQTLDQVVAWVLGLLVAGWWLARGQAAR